MTRSIPLVDLEQFRFGGDNRNEFVQQFGEALIEFGFVRVRGHGIGQLEINDCYQAAREFFSLSTSEKMACHLPGALAQRGYTPLRSEKSTYAPDKPDLKEFFHAGRYGLKPDNLWPTAQPGFRQVFDQLYSRLDAVALILLRALAEHFGLPAEFFADMAQGGNSVLRIIHYPPVGEGDHGGSIRSARHEDINFITLMPAASDTGLQIMTRDGTWLDVETGVNEIIVDSGDMLARMTNGAVPATPHRVINPVGAAGKRSRYSMPFFVHPRGECVLRVHEMFQGKAFPPPPPDITADAFLRQRLEKNYQPATAAS